MSHMFWGLFWTSLETISKGIKKIDSLRKITISGLAIL
jgi:hypothetical protein